ncbi:MAG: histidine kinase [Urechidicola sp.]|nr:histidine kinase [Urechidicola sp.]
MKVVPINQPLLLSVAFLVTMLAIFRRAMALFFGTSIFNSSKAPITLEDIVVRVFFTFLFSWLVLQFNTNWKYRYSNLSFGVRTVLTILFNLLIALIVFQLLFVVYSYVIEITLPQGEKNRFYFGYTVVFIILFFIAGFLRYQIVNQQQVIENEKLKQENLENELVALKNQINPHFLFNSLNSLNSLIRENKEATKFVNKLSYMYRYILQSSNRNLVSLKEELKFLDSYIFLIKTRYRNRFEIEIDLSDDLYEEKLPSLALQLLVENAVKHNEISKINPLIVKVYFDNNYLCVENKIRLRKTLVDSTGNGLSNLNKRCILLKDRKIEISDTDGIFKVKFLLKE